MSIGQSEVRGEDPASERWVQYYSDARARRRARGPELRTREKIRRYRNRQSAMMFAGFLAVGVAIAIYYFYFVLSR
jgi:hypothetical protein